MTIITVTDSVPEIVTNSTATNAAGDEHHDHHDDDQRWIETVLASLPTRSREAQQALAKALLDGDGSMPLLASIPHGSKTVVGLEQPPLKTQDKIKLRSRTRMNLPRRILFWAPFVLPRTPGKHG